MKKIFLLLFVSTTICNAQKTYKNYISKRKINIKLLDTKALRSFTLEDGTLINSFRLSSYDNEFEEEIIELIGLPQSAPSIFRFKTIRRKYYQNGNIRLQTYTLGGHPIGKRSLYSKRGKLIKVIDNEKKIPYSHDIVLKTLKTIKYLNKGKTQEDFNVKFYNLKWIISYTNEETNKWIEYHIDAKTKKLINITVEDGFDD